MRAYLLWLLMFASVACGQVLPPQVPLTATAGAAGNFPMLNSGSFAMPSNTDYTVAFPNTTCIVCNVTSDVSLTATRNLIEPSAGMTFNITNSTTGGQSLVVRAATGSGVTIPNGSSEWVWFNGTNYVEIDPSTVPYPPAGVPLSNGTAWGSSYQVGTESSNLVQLTNSSALPAVSGANLTNLNGGALQSGTVANAALASPSMTVNGATCTLGSSCTVGTSGYPSVVDVYTGTTQQSSTFTHNFPALPSGIYRVSTYLSMTQVSGGTGSSGLSAVVNFTDAVSPVSATIAITSAIPSPFAGNSVIVGTYEFYSNGSAMTYIASTTNSGGSTGTFEVQAITLERLQ